MIKIVIVETLDGETCSLCAQLDGKVYPMSEYQVGVTAPPFHPWCRGTTAPYYEDMVGLGDRFARDVKIGESFDIPKDMTYDVIYRLKNRAIDKMDGVFADNVVY